LSNHVLRVFPGANLGLMCRQNPDCKTGSLAAFFISQWLLFSCATSREWLFAQLFYDACFPSLEGGL